MPLFGYLLIVLLIIEGVFGIFIINKFRIDKAKEYYVSAKNSSDQKSTLSLLIKSTFLSPSDKKKREIINIYYKEKEPQKAEYWLKKLGADSRHLLLAQHYVSTGEIEKYDLIKKKLTDNQKKELDSCLEFINGNFNKLEKPKSGSAPLLLLLDSINRREYEPQDGYLGTLLFESRATKQTDTELTFSANLISANQNILARYILERLITEDSNLKDSHKLMSESFAGEGKYIEALENSLTVLNIDPSDETAYRDAIRYAEMAGKDEEVVRLKSILERITTIKK